MQLLFTREELKMVSEILEAEAARDPQSKPKAYALLDRIIAHDLGFAFDELEDLQDLVSAYAHAHHEQLAVPAQLLEKITDKITEACAMV